MIKVSNILNDYSINRKDLLVLLKNATWKDYSENIRVIWEATFKKIEKDIKNSRTGNLDKKENIKKTSNNVVKKKADHKSVTSDDIQWMDFLANTLWINSWEKKFSKKKVDKNNKNEDTNKREIVKNEEKKQNLEKPSFKVRKKDDLNKSKLNNNDNLKNSNNFRVQKKWPKTRNDFKKLRKEEQEKKRQLENKPKKVKKPKTSDTLKKKDKIVMQDAITVKELSERVWLPVSEIIKTFVLNWMPVGINSSVDFDTVALLSEDLWIKVEKENVKSDINSMFEWKLKDIVESKNALSDDLKERPPIVTIMWHVDHGKTKLLDYLRKTDVVWKEAGSITQSIWASEITHDGKNITFIDTPWHELFTSMRARGSKITDIAVIVVAADDWVKQQTIEAIDHAKAAWVTIMVAITKIDKPNVNIDIIKSQMSEHGLMPEDWWGSIPFVQLSSITWDWVDEFLELINLQAEMLELKYNPKAPAVWVVLEASKDAKMWTIATILPITWTLHKKDAVVAYDVYGRMKMMKNWAWKVVKEVHAWDPVQIMWFEWIPWSWRIFEVFDSEKEAQKQVSKIKDLIKQNENKNVLSSFLDRMKAWENVDLNIILKAWDFGWLEALKYAVWKVNVPEWINLKIIHEEVWQVKETDVSLAEASQAFIFGFDSSIQSSLKKKLEQKKIIFKNFTIIYELLEYLENLAAWMVKKEIEEVKIWEFEMLAMFFKKWNDMIIWWKVKQWVVKNWAHFGIRRWDEELWWGKITSVKIDQENVNEVKEWRECWIRVRTWKRFKEWDILDIYIYE